MLAGSAASIANRGQLVVMAKPKEIIPADLREGLEEARLDGLALFRALDRLDLGAAEIPQELLHELFELDADYAEALWALDQPASALDTRVMVRDTLASLRRRPTVLKRFLAGLPARATKPLNEGHRAVRAALRTADAYEGIPGHE